jgi:RNA polymerase sigma factor (sigma-70 family)
MITPPGNLPIPEWLIAALRENQLLPGLTEPMLPQLAQAIEPVIQRYVVDEGGMPDRKLFATIVNNYLHDAPRVQALLTATTYDENGHWATLHNALRVQVQQQWPRLSTTDQAEVAHEAWVRVQRYLQNFAYRARFSTWVATILRNYALTWWAKHRLMIENEVSIDTLTEAEDEEADTSARSLFKRQSLLSTPDHSQSVEQNELRERLWQRIEELGDQESVRILRLLYVEGYTQSEIAQQLGLSNASITRRKQQLLTRLANDDVIKKLSGQDDEDDGDADDADTNDGNDE